MYRRRTGTDIFWNMDTPFLTSVSATSCGVQTMHAPEQDITQHMLVSVSAMALTVDVHRLPEREGHVARGGRSICGRAAVPLVLVCRRRHAWRVASGRATNISSITRREDVRQAPRKQGVCIAGCAGMAFRLGCVSKRALHESWLDVFRRSKDCGTSGTQRESLGRGQRGRRRVE